MTLNNKLHNYLNSNFPDLEIRQPLFYSWNIGLRFDLHEEYSTSDEEYFYNVFMRASILFKSVFKPSDQITIIYQEYTNNKNKIRKGNYLFRQIKDLNFSEIEFKKVTGLYEFHNKWNRVIIETTVNKINYRNIIRAIANQDFPDRTPNFKGELFFINKDKNIIFHMYDDRGLDIISNKIEELVDTYNTYNHWILEYDRKQIENIFDF